jgi:nucleotide-binding universal stress UspA family protein
VNTGAPYGGSAAEWIVEETETRHADFIIMATHDRIGPDRWIHGSVAESVVSRSTIPVMLVRADTADRLAERFQTPEPVVVVPLDGSELAEAALPVARGLATTLGARAVLVGVVPRAGQLLAGQGGAIVPYAGSGQAETEAEARAYLEAAAGPIATSATGVTTVLRYGDPASEIAAVAQESAAAAVVMATHGRTGLVRSILGSVAGGVLHHNSTPVVLIRPPELRGAEEPAVNNAVAASTA